MNKYLFIACICLLYSETQAQNDTTNHSPGKIQSSSGGIALNRLGVCTIKLKDGTRLIKCAIKEITPLFVSYVKNKTLHDIMIDKIKCIVPENENIVICFDVKNRAITGADCP